MHRIVPILSAAAPADLHVRKPRFETRQHAGSLELIVYVPGVEPGGLDLAVDAQHELIVTARKPRPVRRNWQAANFEAVQSDYQLRVQLAPGIDPHHIRAVLRDGVLRIHLRPHSAFAERKLSVA